MAQHLQYSYWPFPNCGKQRRLVNHIAVIVHHGGL